MTQELPRFNQRFVNSLQYGSNEQQFVSSVGDITFLTRAHLRTLDGIQTNLKEPLYHMDSNPDIRAVERALYFESYSSMFESTLIHNGLQEYVISLNSLKHATSCLKGRNIAWNSERQSENPDAGRFDEYIAGSMIGFYPNSLEAPALGIELTKDGDTRGRLVDLEDMWNIEVYPLL